LYLLLLCVQPFYMSPEQVMETAYNAKSDIWSLGRWHQQPQQNGKAHMLQLLVRVMRTC